MKKINYILLPFLSLVLFASCDNAIDIKQPGQLYAEDTFQTVEDLQKGVNACYVPFAGSPDSEIAFASIFTDEVSIGPSNNGQGITGDATYLFTLNTNSSAPASVWQGNYTLINYANRVITAAKTITPSDKDKAAYDNVRAQALIFRAWGHFKLLSYFAANMDKDHDASPGVIKVDFVPKTSDKLGRNTVGEVYNLIKSDLDTADLLLNGDLLQNSGQRYFLSKDFVTAFRARLAAYRGDYDAAADAVNTLKATGNYPLTPFAQYKSIWTDNVAISTNEVIFKLKRLSGDNSIGKTWANNNSSITGQPFYIMSTEVYNSLNNSKDARKNSFIDASSTSTVRCIGKYPSPAAGSSGQTIVWLNDVKIFRMSEMYFIMAENYASKGDFGNVQKTLQDVNKARFSGTAPTIATPTTPQEAWALILTQRRIELCYEGHRFLDLKRLSAKAGLNNGSTVTVGRSDSDCSNNVCTTAPVKGPIADYKFAFPIPTIELTANPVISKQQNPGY